MSSDGTREGNGRGRRLLAGAALVGALSVLALLVGGALQPRGGASPAAAAPGDIGYPRVIINEELTNAGRYQGIIGRANWASNMQGLRNSTSGSGEFVALRYFAPRQYQTDVMSMPYNEIYDGHWLLLNGSTVTSALNASQTSIPVASTGPFSGLTGYYAMIFDATAVNGGLDPNNPAFWNNAEHVKINSISGSNLNVTRGWNHSDRNASPANVSSHPNGSRIAIHAPGSFTGPDVWSLNLSTASPRDAQSRQFNQVLAEWLGDHLNHVYNKNTGTYTNYPNAWDGASFDGTAYWINRTQPPSGNSDVDNNGSADGGVLQPGRSAWGEGMDVFFQLSRQELGPNAILHGGSMATRGGAYFNGVDLEGFPGSGHSSSNSRVWSTALANYFMWDQEAGDDPQYTSLFTRIGTDEYLACDQFGHVADQGTNADFRLGLGASLLADGYFTYTNGCYGEYWWDEYAVDFATGDAIPESAGQNALREDSGYLGQPLGPAQRLLNPSGNNLLAGTNWSLATSGGANGNVSNSGGVTTVNITSPGANLSNLQMQSNPVSFVANREYTLKFRARADNGRTAIDLARDVDISHGSGGKLGGAFISGQWRDYYIDFVAPQSTSGRITFEIGSENGTFSISDAALYESASDLFRRDFQNGIVIVNATFSNRTVNLGGNFRRIDGNQDPSFNNGATVSSVTLASHDAIILLRPSGGTPLPTSTPTRTSTPGGPTATPTRTPTPGATATATPTSGGGGGNSDLRILSLLNPPANGTAGGDISVAAITRNYGPGSAPATTTRFYLSLNTAKDGSDTLLGGGGLGVPALGNGQQFWSEQNAAIPAGTPVGTYYVVACADDTNAASETNEANNCKASSTTIAVTAPGGLPDLRVPAMENPPAVVTAGGAMNVADTTKNFGPGAAPATTTRYYLSLNTTKGGGDVLLSGNRAVPALSSGAQSWGSRSVTIPGSTVPGLYYLLACSDDLAVAAETNNGNNCRASATRVGVV